MIPGHQDDQSVRCTFPRKVFEPECWPTLANVVQRKLEPDQEDESGQVDCQVERRISLIADRRAEIVRSIVFDMVVLVMIVKRVPGLAHHWPQYVGKEHVDAAARGGEDARPVDVMMGDDRVGPNKVDNKHPMQDSMYPSEAKKQQRLTRKADQRKSQEM